MLCLLSYDVETCVVTRQFTTQLRLADDSNNGDHRLVLEFPLTMPKVQEVIANSLVQDSHFAKRKLSLHSCMRLDARVVDWKLNSISSLAPFNPCWNV